MAELTPQQEQLLDAELAKIEERRAQEDRAGKQVQASLDQLVQQIQEARGLLDQAAGRIAALGLELKKQARRAPEMSAAHTLFVGSHLRMAGAIQQVVRRTSQTDRTLILAARQQEAEAARAIEQAKVAKRRDFQRHLDSLPMTPESALADLFDEDAE